MSASTSTVSQGFRTNDLNKSAQILKKRKQKETKNAPPTRSLNKKNKLMLSILSLTKQDLQLHNNNLLAKGIAWLINELSDFGLFENTKQTINKTMKNNNDRDNNNKSNNNALSASKNKLQYNKKIINNTNANIHHHNSNNNPQSIKPRKPDDLFNKLKPFQTNQSRPIEKLKLHNMYFTTEPNSKEQTVYSVSSHAQPSLNLIQLSEEIIQTIDKPSFNIFDLEDELGSENTLSVLSSYVFLSYGLYSIINVTRADAFIRYITKGYYRTNNYHNDLHAADVLHTSIIILKYSNIATIASFSTMDICALFLSTIVHDFKHPGVNNNYLVQTSNKIALRYNDTSVLENYHIAQMFKLIKSKNNCDIFCDLEKEDYCYIRKRMISCVLATDMIHHNEMISFLNQLAERKQSSGIDDAYLLFYYNSLNIKDQSNMQQEYVNLVMHSSDISNPTKPFEIYKRWAELVVSEFFAQGDRERDLGLPISYLCDRTQISMHQAQTGFIDNVILPLYQPLIKLFSGLNFLMENITKNKKEFDKLILKDDNKENKE